MVRYLGFLFVLLLTPAAQAADECADALDTTVRKLHSQQTLDLCALTRNKLTLVVAFHPGTAKTVFPDCSSASSRVSSVPLKTCRHPVITHPFTTRVRMTCAPFGTCERLITRQALFFSQELNSSTMAWIMSGTLSSGIWLQERSAFFRA